MITFGATVGGNLKVSVEELVFLKKTFKFPPTVAPNVVIFAHIIAKIFLYPKSLDSAQMVKYLRRTSSQSATRHFLPTHKSRENGVKG